MDPLIVLVDSHHFCPQSCHLVCLAKKIGEVRFSTKIQIENVFFGKTNLRWLLRQNWAKFSYVTILPPNAPHSQLGLEKSYGAGFDVILNRHALRPSKQYWITCPRKQKSEFDSDENQQALLKDPLHVPVGPTTRARSKKIKEALNGLIQDIWADFTTGHSKLGPKEDEGVINLIQAADGADHA